MPQVLAHDPKGLHVRNKRENEINFLSLKMELKRMKKTDNKSKKIN